jgi:hypothetical protein
MKSLKAKITAAGLVLALLLVGGPLVSMSLASDQLIYTTIEEPDGFGMQVLAPTSGAEIYGKGVTVELAVTNIAQLRFYDNGQLIFTLDVNETGTVHRSVVLPIQQIGQHQIMAMAVSLDDRTATTAQVIEIYYMGDPDGDGILGNVLPPTTGVFRIGNLVVTSYGLMVCSVITAVAAIALVTAKRQPSQAKGRSSKTKQRPSAKRR